MKIQNVIRNIAVVKIQTVFWNILMLRLYIRQHLWKQCFDNFHIHSLLFNICSFVWDGVVMVWLYIRQHLSNQCFDNFRIHFTIVFLIRMVKFVLLFGTVLFQFVLLRKYDFWFSTQEISLFIKFFLSQISQPLN